MLKIKNLGFFLALTTLAACTTENTSDDGTSPGDGGNPPVDTVTIEYLPKIYTTDLIFPVKVPLSMEYDILPYMLDLHYKEVETDRYDIGTPERLEKFRKWFV